MVNGGHEKHGWVVYIVELETGREVWLVPVEEAFHPTLDTFSNWAVINPVLD
jgi:hypothetical protein